MRITMYSDVRYGQNVQVVLKKRSLPKMITEKSPIWLRISLGNSVRL